MSAPSWTRPLTDLDGRWRSAVAAMPFGKLEVHSTWYGPASRRVKGIDLLG